jgi:putative aminopeptidase FrvX
VDDLTTDALGNLIGAKWGSGCMQSRRRIMLAAHMDEIGMLVRAIDGSFIRVASIGGIDGRVMMAQPVMVHGKEPLPGVVASKPPHVLKAEERSQYPATEDLLIDVGLSAEEVRAKVRIGDPVTVDVPALDLVADRLMGKALDDRACVAAVSWCLHELKARQHRWDVLAVATVQEEVGSRGAEVAAYHLKPDLAIALDVTFAKQPGVGDGDNAYALGSAPVISMGPNFHPGLGEKLADAPAAWNGRGPRSHSWAERHRPWPIQVAQAASPRRCSASPSATCTARWRSSIWATSSAPAGCWPNSSQGWRRTSDHDCLEGPAGRVRRRGGEDRMMLKELSDAFGVSGAEEEVRGVILKAIQGHVEDIRIDPLGNVLAVKRGRNPQPGDPRVMVAAHMDEVGFMVMGVEGDGTLRVAGVGGFDARILPGLRLVFGQDRIPGVIGWKPIHLGHDSAVVNLDRLRVDIGASSKEQANGKVKVGDRGSFDTKVPRLGRLATGKRSTTALAARC